MASRPEFERIFARYRDVGIVKGAEFLLRPGDALRLVDDLEAASVAILEVDTWRYVDAARGWLVQQLECQLEVPDEDCAGPDAAHRSARLAREFIRARVRPPTDFVSFSLDVPPDWSYFGA